MDLSNNNFIPFIFSIFPALIYALIIFLTFPYKSIKIKTAGTYLLIGSISILWVYAFNYIFPNWKNILAGEFITSMFFECFIQIALVEELCKYIAFKSTDLIRPESSFKDNPISIMFYYCMTSTAFAIIENVQYTMIFGETVIPIRTFSAIILHMICGLFVGYFIAKGIMIDENSKFDTKMRKFPIVKRGIYTFLGLCLAIFTHGLYNFNISLNLFNPNFYKLNMCILLSFALYTTYSMAKDLINTKQIK